jgi:hypothetical protein
MTTLSKTNEERYTIITSVERYDTVELTGGRLSVAPYDVESNHRVMLDDMGTILCNLSDMSISQLKDPQKQQDVGSVMGGITLNHQEDTITSVVVLGEGAQVTELTDESPYTDWLIAGSNVDHRTVNFLGSVTQEEEGSTVLRLQVSPLDGNEYGVDTSIFDTGRTALVDSTGVIDITYTDLRAAAVRLCKISGPNIDSGKIIAYNGE